MKRGLLNALNRDLITALRELFASLYWRRDVRVVVLRGAGHAFCAGLDLKDRRVDNAGRTTGAALDSQRGISEIVIAMRRCPQPIVALLDGPAAGGGFALALASDICRSVSSARSWKRMRSKRRDDRLSMTCSARRRSDCD